MKNKLLILLGAGLLSFLAPNELAAQVPTAQFTVVTNACEGQTVQITDNSTDSPTAWSYTIEGVASVATVQNPVVTFTSAGIYNITLIASNGNGDSSPAVETITINALPSVTVTPMTDVCLGDMTTLSGSGASTYVWTGGITDNTPFAATTSTTYVVTGTDGNGCSNTASASVNVKPIPTVAISGGTAVCMGSAISLTATGADSFAWVNGPATNELTDSPTANTTYTVIGTDAVTSCTNSSTTMITVNALPTVTVNSAAVCEGSIFTMNPGGAQSYGFSNGSSTVVVLANGSYTVTGTDANGCVNTAVAEVTLNPSPVITVNDGTICAGTVFTITPNGAQTYSYSSTGNTNTVSPTANATYTVTGTDLNGCISAEVVSTVSVNPLPAASVNSGTLCAGDVFTINPTGADSFTFVTGSNTVSPTTSTSYTIEGSDNATGCISRVVSAVTVYSLPVISSPNGTLCVGSVYTLSPTGANSYIYSSGDATVAPTSNASYSITGVSAEGCKSASEIVVAVTVYTLPVVSVTSGTICLGSVYTMTASGASTYVYSNGNATISPLVTTTVGVTGVSTEGCTSSNTAIATISVNALPAVNIATINAICAGETATLNVTGASTFTWNTNSNDASYTVAPIANTGYTVEGTDANGCKNTASYTVVVNQLPVISVNSGTICPGGSFTMTPNGATSYVFSSGNAVVSPNATTSYSVVGTDANGCVSALVVSTVNVLNSLTITVSGNTTICSGQTATLTANGATTYSWNTNNQTGTLNVNPTANTSYTVTGMSSGCSNTAVVSVAVNALPSLTISSNASTLICIGESVVLTASGANSYAWNGNAGTANYTVNPTANTTYTLVGTDANSCSNSVVYNQEVQDCTGLPKNAASAEFNVYPNPTTGEFFVRLSESAHIVVMNGIGQTVLSSDLKDGVSQLSLNDQPKGIYFVQVKQGNSVQILKIVKN
ncbi:MAG: T9SS type A sorting domain-containing protein [Bacteroidia bacterium]|nr:T9SS type A sorting domain-containing protein [Bacteroidia bacterium]